MTAFATMQSCIEIVRALGFHEFWEGNYGHKTIAICSDKLPALMDYVPRLQPTNIFGCWHRQPSRPASGHIFEGSNDVWRVTRPGGGSLIQGQLELVSQAAGDRIALLAWAKGSHSLLVSYFPCFWLYLSLQSAPSQKSSVWIKLLLSKAHFPPSSHQYFLSSHLKKKTTQQCWELFNRKQPCGAWVVSDLHRPSANILSGAKIPQLFC